MNEHGHRATLRAAQPGNRHAVRSGVYSLAFGPSARRGFVLPQPEPRRSRSHKQRSATRSRDLNGFVKALDEDIAAWGPSTRAGAARGQVSQRSSVSRQLARLELTWAMGEPVEGDDIVDRGSEDGAGSLREELLAVARAP